MRCRTRDDVPGPAALWAGGRRCTARPARLVSPLGVGGDCVTLPRGGRSGVPRGGPGPATRSIRRPVGTLTQHAADRIIRCIA